MRKMKRKTAILLVLVAVNWLLLGQLAGSYTAYAGGADAAGGNTVGDKLFDDFENEGTTVIPAATIEKLAKPTLQRLQEKLPHFADQLKEGIKGITWYFEPKPLAQKGPCLNSSTLAVNQVVRACQTSLNVRIDEQWAKSNPELFQAIVIHELLVYQRIRNSDISQEGVLEVSRAIRNQDPQKQLAAEQLRVLINKAGFGMYATKAELDSIENLYKRVINIEVPAACRLTNNPDAFEYSRQRMQKLNSEIIEKYHSMDIDNFDLSYSFSNVIMSIGDIISTSFNIKRFGEEYCQAKASVIENNQPNEGSNASQVQ